MSGSRATLELARRISRRVLGGPEVPSVVTDLTGQAASDHIRELIASGHPAMMARLGGVELDCLLNYDSVQSPGSQVRKSLAFIRGRESAPWWRDVTIEQMSLNAGFFPRDTELLERFAERMLADMPYVDVLGSWQPAEDHFRADLSAATTVRLRDLEPYYGAPPWSEALEGRTVLVVHPFAETIRSQYARREMLFADPRVLPKFELKTVKAVQSIAGTATRFRDWFEALAAMSEEIAATEFDVALIGCGAYGFPLAAHVKRLGRAAVHLGGACQILFGIKGRRWDNHEVIGRLYNGAWVTPSETERPKNYRDVEGGCYW